MGERRAAHPPRGVLGSCRWQGRESWGHGEEAVGFPALRTCSPINVLSPEFLFWLSGQSQQMWAALPLGLTPGVGVGGQARLPRVSWESRGRCHPATCPRVSQLALGASVTASVKWRGGGKTEHCNARGLFCFQDLGSSQALDRVGGRQEGRRGTVPAAHLLTPQCPAGCDAGVRAPWGELPLCEDWDRPARGSFQFMQGFALDIREARPPPALSVQSSCDETPQNPTPGNLGEPCTPGLCKNELQPYWKPHWPSAGWEGVGGPCPPPVQILLEEAGCRPFPGEQEARGLCPLVLGS